MHTLRSSEKLIESNPYRCSATLFSLSVPSTVHQYVPHRARSDAKKMGAVLPVDPIRSKQPQINFVNKSRGLKGIPWSLPPEVGCGYTTEVSIDLGNELSLGAGITASNTPK